MTLIADANLLQNTDILIELMHAAYQQKSLIEDADWV
jgi:hypothetical protein